MQPAARAALWVGIPIAAALVFSIAAFTGILAYAVAGGAHKATWNEREAAATVGPEWWWEMGGDSAAKAYHLGLQKIRAAHGKIGDLTILQVTRIGEHASTTQRSVSVQRKRKGHSASHNVGRDVQRSEEAEVAKEIHPSDLVKSHVIVDSKLGLIIDRDVWDSLSHQDKKLFFNRVYPIWKSIYIGYNPSSDQTVDVMLFDLNQDFVTDYGSFTVWGK